MNVEDAVPEMTAYREWKAAAVELQAAQIAMAKANDRFRQALQKLSEIVAPMAPVAPLAAQ